MAYIIHDKPELIYSMGGGYNGAPTIALHGYTTVPMDPFPAYGHPTSYVEERIQLTEKAFPLPFPIHWYLPEFEALDRFNGCCWGDADYETAVTTINGRRIYKNKGAHIVLSGKRIVIMPAMTRYLVAHEYGHAVEDHLYYSMDLSEDEFRSFYRELRGIKEPPAGYNGRSWHRSIGEIIANDFRILVCGAEPEFWPHEVCRPEESYAAIGFWRTAVEKYAAFDKGPILVPADLAQEINEKVAPVS